VKNAIEVMEKIRPVHAIDEAVSQANEAADGLESVEVSGAFGR